MKVKIRDEPFSGYVYNFEKNIIYHVKSEGKKYMISFITTKKFPEFFVDEIELNLEEEVVVTKEQMEEILKKREKK